MADMRAHGGGCCGMRHISGMSLNETYTERHIENDIAYHIRSEEGGRLFEVVLNERQTGDNRVLNLLRKYGFTLVSSFNNRTGSRCAIFHRADNRVPLSYWRTRWNGMVITPEMQGLLPRIPGTIRAIRPEEYRNQTRNRNIQPNGYTANVGDVVHVTNIDSDYHGQHGRVVSTTADTLIIEFLNGARVNGRTQVRVNRNSVRVTQPANQPNEPQVAIPEQAPWAFPTHANAGAESARPAASVVPAPQQVAPEPAPRPLFTFYYNVLRTGRSQAGWPTYAAARNTAPRIRQVDACTHFSDGSTRWTTNVAGDVQAMQPEAVVLAPQADGYPAED